MTVETVSYSQVFRNLQAAVRGGINHKTNHIAAHPPKNEVWVPGGNLDIIARQMLNDLGYRARLAKFDLTKPHYWQNVPWSHGNIHPRNLLASFAAFSDDPGTYVDEKYFPSDIAQCLVQNICDNADRMGRPLTLNEQFVLALEKIGPYPTACAIALHAGIRGIGRNMDSRMGIKSGPDKMQKLALSLADVTDTGDQIGDTYHVWGVVASVLTGNSYMNGRRLNLDAYLLLHSGRFAEPIAVVRKKVFGTETAHDHRLANALGQSIASKIWNEFH
ncbi:hypothetical protein IPM62_01980 [Candidatus Woesebacteria bacterium]|nr:MAG: hypothetical protein IPM62_01980 [Candidatus Woesebacteria bacterium]